MPNKLKVGIVDCGGVAQQEHIPGFLRLNNVVLQSVCDKNDKLAQQTAAKYRIPQVYSSLPDMFSAEKLDIIDICTPPQTHAPLALEALQNGCHVLMEKPMALKTSDCDEMIDASRKSGAKLCIIHNKLFKPTFFKARRLVAEGDTGYYVEHEDVKGTAEAIKKALKDKDNSGEKARERIKKKFTLEERERRSIDLLQNYLAKE